MQGVEPAFAGFLLLFALPTGPREQNISRGVFLFLTKLSLITIMFQWFQALMFLWWQQDPVYLTVLILLIFWSIPAVRALPLHGC